MIPYLDTVARRYPPFVVWTLIAANTGVFLFEIGLPPHLQERLFYEYALVPARFFGELRALSPGNWWVFLTNTFLHGGWVHLIFNMWSLWIFGPAVEDRFGPTRFLSFYLLCGTAASLAHALVNPGSGIPALGASGAIAGVMGCYARLFPAARLIVMVPVGFIPFFFDLPAIVFATIWMLMQTLAGVMRFGQDMAMGGIAWWAHIGGFAAGWILAPLFHRPSTAYRRFFPDEGRYGYLPDGRRDRGHKS